MAFLETPRFPANIAMRAVGGPGYLTQVVSLRSGYEQRTSLWQYARGTWDVGQVVDTATNYQTLVAFFRAVGGKRDGFRFKDWTDFTDGGTGVLGTTGLGDGTTTVFQMFKNYPQGVNSDQRSIRKPVSGTCAFTKNGGTAVGVTVDYTTGLVTFGTAPLAAAFTGSISGTALTVSGVTGVLAIGQTIAGAGVAAGTIITGGGGLSWTVNNAQTVGAEAMTSGDTLAWTGQFDVPCRFDTDELKIQVVEKNATDLLVQWPSIPLIEIRV